MQFLKRTFLFLLTNIAVIALLSVVMMVINMFFPGLLSMYGGMGQLLVYAFVIGFGGAFISLFISRWSAKQAYNIVLLDAKTALAEPKLELVWNTVSRIALSEGIDMPEVGYYQSDEPNAFATGASKNKSLVAVSTGLLNQMEKNEIEGVVGHEMAHILNGDMVTLTLIQGVMNTFVVFLSHIASRFVVSFFSKGEEDSSAIGSLSYGIISIVFQIVFGFLASFVVMWFSRVREYRADLGGAKYTSKSHMIAGLKKLKKISEKVQQTPSVDPKMNAFMINEPDSFFSTHPSLDNRMKALEENYQLA
ncbi:protease HtpX [Candidatus Gracilibacteria bacterium]|nr:protease HtpX [Candidatus Gracilibacteria bacterium]